MRTILTRFCCALTLSCAVHVSTASDLRSMDAAETAKLAASIPVAASGVAAANVETRMRSIGLTVTGGRAYSYDSKGELEQPGDKVGDLHFTIQGTQPSSAFKSSTCDMSGNADFLKRGRQVLSSESNSELVDDSAVLHDLC